MRRNHLDEAVWARSTGFMVCDAGSLFDGLRVPIYKEGGVVASIGRVFSIR